MTDRQKGGKTEVKGTHRIARSNRSDGTSYSGVSGLGRCVPGGLPNPNRTAHAPLIRNGFVAGDTRQSTEKTPKEIRRSPVDAVADWQFSTPRLTTEHDRVDREGTKRQRPHTFAQQTGYGPEGTPGESGSGDTAKTTTQEGRRDGFRNRNRIRGRREV